jgi:hypothetical protein
MTETQTPAESAESLESLEPRALWGFFLALSKIPRGSRNEAAAADWVAERGRALGGTVERDAVGNVLIRKAASPGREGRPAVALQCHVDMVCEQNEGTGHDFTRDPIRVRRVGDHLRATGTTLGADNGIGVAAALAVLGGRHPGAPRGRGPGHHRRRDGPDRRGQPAAGLAEGHAPAQPGQRGRGRGDDRLRRRHRHPGAPCAAFRADPGRGPCPARETLRPEGRPLGHRHRPGPRQRAAPARADARAPFGHTGVRAREPVRRQQTQRHPARGRGRRRRAGRRGRGQHCAHASPRPPRSGARPTARSTRAWRSAWSRPPPTA